MQENGYYRARVTAESNSIAANQQINILFHITTGEPAHVGQVEVAGHSAFSPAQIQEIARMRPGDRVTAARITNSLQRLRKKFQKQQRVLGQVSICRPEIPSRIECRRLYLSRRARTGRPHHCARFPHQPWSSEKAGASL